MTRSETAVEDALTAVELVGPDEACVLLGLSAAYPPAALRRYEAENRILRIDWKGQAVYPRFQFDKAEHEVHPALLEVMAMRTDDWGGTIALMHWLTRPNRSLGGARPCDRLSEDGDRIVAAFGAELSEPFHG
ncbi:hypothetical protein [Limimaricola soesokkakensis]|uniref:hypothetical protein n=1 Tax=Limimaricola soesokkakensis TaxID=1343159 RepID=UPI0035184E75